MKKVLLVSMPFADTKFPAIGISLLKAELHEEGISCDVKYFNIDFAEMIGLGIYEDIVRIFSGEMLIGEWLFAQYHYGKQLPDAQEYIRYLRQVFRAYDIPGDHLDNILGVKRYVKPFVEHCLESVSWEMYDIVGFTTMFEQNMASVSLVHRVKMLHPGMTIVFGGANCEGVMGSELHRCFPIIDYVCSGEADFTFPRLVKRVRERESVEDIPGVIYRKNGRSVETQSAQMVENLDVLPYPDYDDYFDQLEQTGFSASICEELPMETSRGCWWGEKSQCTFCGVNGCSIGFRSKSKDRVIEELIHFTEKYVKKYAVTQVSMVDNILDMRYFRELLPELKERQLPVQLFYETKSNLNREQVKMLYEAGVTWIQPGIESLNTHVLELMGKGVSALRNIQLLKYCKQFGVVPGWSMLRGLPGERSEDYRQILDLIYSKIIHLPPPSADTRFILQRFSPYFNSSEKYGIINVRPRDAYRFVYPFDDSSLFNLAYDFRFDYREDVEPPAHDKEVSEAVAYWQERYSNNEYLRSVELSPSALLIEDGRSNAVVSQIMLESAQKDVYEYCDRIRSFSSIFPHIRAKYSEYPIRSRDVKDFLDEMVALNFMVNEDDKYLSVAIPVEVNHHKRG